MKPGAYWAKGPDGWELFEVDDTFGGLHAWGIGWHSMEPLSELARTYTTWQRIDPPTD